MKIINPNEIGSKISTLISESNQTFCAVTPYLDLSKWKKILINLENAVKRNIKITFYFREIRDKDFNVLKALGVELIKIDGLHTKLYFNESQVIVTSMNLYEFSDLYSIDIAIYFDELEEYKKIYEYFEKYIKNKSSSKKKIEKESIISLEKLHNDLKIHYPKFEITKSSNYLYSKDLSCVFHLFIRLDSITIKYPKKDFSEGLINELEDNILEVYKENNIIRNEFDFKKQEDFFYWDIRLSNNVKRTSNLIVALYNMKIPDTISDGIVKKNII